MVKARGKIDRTLGSLFRGAGGALPLLLGLACGHRQPAPVVSSSASGVAGACPATFSSVAAKRTGVTRILITDFYGTSGGDAGFADAVANKIDVELLHLRDEKLPSMSPPISTADIEFQRVHCFVSSHLEAERLAAVWSAELVIWGQSYCSTTPELQRTINVNQITTITGPVTVEGGSTFKTNSATIEKAKPYAVCPSATLYRSDASLRRSSSALDFDNLGHLDLPTLSSVAPFQLVTFTIGLHFLEHGQPWAAAHLFEQSVKDVLSPADQNIGALHGYLGQAYLELPDGAQKSLAFSTAAMTTVENTGSADEATLENNIGAAFLQQGKADDSLKHLTRALAIDEKLFGEKTPPVVIALNNIGAAYQSQGKLDEALTYFQRAVDIDEKVKPPDGLKLAKDWKHVASILVEQGKADQALTDLNRVLPVLAASLGEDHPAVARTQGMIGQALFKVGRYDEALRSMSAARRSLEKTLGPNHPDVGIAVSDEGSVLKVKGDVQGALDHYRRAATILEGTSSYPLDRANVLNNLATLLDELKFNGEALGYWKKVLRADDLALPADDLRIFRVLNRVAEGLHGDGNDKKAAEDYERAFGIATKWFGPQAPETKMMEGNLALCRAIVSGFVPGEGKGAVVIGFNSGSQGKQAGLEIGDWIVEYNKHPVHGSSQLNLFAAAAKPHVSDLVVVRQARRVHVQVTSGDLGVSLGE